MMAATTSRPKAQLLRELNSTRHSSTSSRQSQSTRSSEFDFDPENEAIMSTRQLDDVAQKLPEMRASAKKYQRPRFPEPEYNIDTSALAKAFPDFSQGNFTESSDFSIELGRGTETTSRKPNRNTYGHGEFSSNGDIILTDDSLTFKAPLKSNAQAAQGAPRDHQQQYKTTTHASDRQGSRSQTYRSSGLRNEIATSPAAKSKDYGSSESRKSSEGARRTLSAMHAKARNENDQSFLGEDRPPTIDLTMRSTRFNAPKSNATQQPQLPTKYRASQGLQHGQASQRKPARNVVASQMTQGSFQLPELPNVSELVSGVFEDGTPVYSRHGKSRIGRSKQAQEAGLETKIDEVPVPADEQAIFLSLKILEDRVALLQREKAGLEVTVKELEGKNHRLETGGDRHRNDGSDSALGLADSEDQDDFQDQRQYGHTGQQSRLASTVKKLKHQLGISERKVSTTENIIRNVTQERDSAVSQLGVAYVTIEQLKAENESSQSEVQELKAHIQQISAHTHGQTSVSSERVNAIKKKVADLKEAHGAANSKNRRQEPAVNMAQASAHSQFANVAPAQETQADDYDELFDLTPRAHETNRNASYGQLNNHLQEAKRQPELIGKNNATSKTDAVPKKVQIDTIDGDDSGMFTELSYIDTKDIVNMREALEVERLKTRNGDNDQPRWAKGNLDGHNEMQQAAESTRNLGSRRSTTIAASEKRRSRSSGAQLPGDGNIQTAHNRRHSEPSVVSTRSRRRGQMETNMTSAFIIPDITIGHKKPLTSNAVSQFDDTQATENYEDEPTMRPSQKPSLALAAVIKSFEDEISTLKKQLARYQEQYNSHNPALSKRRRKYVFEKMESTLQAIDAKSDQLYSLYDVLEGQKQSGQELTQEDVDLTLESIGIGASELKFSTGERNANKSHRGKSQLGDLDSQNGVDDDLPWEGIEASVDTNKTGSTHGHRRRGSRF